jgi:hypothetical protein
VTTSAVSRFGLLLGRLFLAFFHRDDNGRDDADCGKAAGHEPVTHDVAEALDKHDRDCGERKARRNHKRDGDRCAGNVFQHKSRDRGLGLVDQSREHGGLLRFPERAQDESDGSDHRQGCHWLILHRFVDGTLEVAGNFPGPIADLARLIGCAGGSALNPIRNLLELVRRLVGKVGPPAILGTLRHCDAP